MPKLAFSESEFQTDLRVTSLEGEAGYTTLERRSGPGRPVISMAFSVVMPDLDPKPFSPARGSAKLSFRLVPDQDPQTVAQQFKDHVAKVCPPGVTYEIISHHGAPAVLVNIDTPG